MLLFLLLSVIRLSSNVTKRSNTSSADFSAGDRSRSFLRSSLTELIAESTSISSMVNCLHPFDFVYDYYRTGFQNGILASVCKSDAFKNMIRPHACRSHKKPTASFLWLGSMTIEASRQPSQKSEKCRKTLSSTFIAFQLNSYVDNYLFQTQQLWTESP